MAAYIDPEGMVELATANIKFKVWGLGFGVKGLGFKNLQTPRLKTMRRIRRCSRQSRQSLRSGLVC